MLSSVYVNTTNLKLGIFWPSEGHKRDWDYAAKVGMWIQKNERVLNKKAIPDAVHLVAEEFPDVVEVDARDYANRGARWRK